MLPPPVGRAALQIAAWIVLVAGAMLPFLERGSAEFILTAISLLIGLIFGVVVWFLTRRSLK